MMTKSIKGTRTEKNLLAAFAGESQARNRYTFYASVARKEGYEQIAHLFLETAENEKEHAKVFFKYLEGGIWRYRPLIPQELSVTQRPILKLRRQGRTWNGRCCMPKVLK